MTNLLFICGSPRDASTAYVIKEAAKAAQEVPDVKVDILSLKGMEINPCKGCNACVKKGVTHCLIYHDDFDGWNEKFWTYDGVLIGTCVYEMGITPQLCAFFSRFRSEWLNQKDDPLARMYMPGAALAVGGTRNGGEGFAISVIHGFYHTEGMPVVNGGLGIYNGACVWSRDRMAEGAADDETGMKNARFLAKKLALTAKALKAAKDRS